MVLTSVVSGEHQRQVEGARAAEPRRARGGGRAGTPGRKAPPFSLCFGLHPQVVGVRGYVQRKVGREGKRNGRRDKKSQTGPELHSPGLGMRSCVRPVLPEPVLLQRAYFWGSAQCSPNYPNQVMEGFVDVERWVLGTGFYVRNLEGKAQLGKSSIGVHKALFPKTANSEVPRNHLPSETPTEPQHQQPQAPSWCLAP